MSTSHEPTPFPPVHTVHPSHTHRHTHTIILLHGLGSSGPEFAAKFFASKSTKPDLLNRFPSMRWVFPSAPIRDGSTLPSAETRPAWFSIKSLSDLESEQDVQMEGLRQSVGNIGDLIGTELELLKGQGRDERSLFVLGRSQGSGAVVWAMLNSLGKFGIERLGGVILTGSWLVFARALQAVRGTDQKLGESYGHENGVNERAIEFVRDLIGGTAGSRSLSLHPLCATPIMIGHSTDDQWISIDLGRQMRDSLVGLGCGVRFNEYVGAAEEGHWMKEPEEMDDIGDFLEMHMA